MGIQRIFILVCDSLGIGELPDASNYGDKGSHTLKHTAQAVNGLHLPTLEKLGLGRIDEIPGISSQNPCIGTYGKMAEQSKGKDTTTGHWEMMGLISEKPFPLYPNGFPPEIMQPFEKAIQRKALGNKPASGTEIIKELGEEHVKTGCPIVYTSGDSVFQIACHEEIVPLETLYDWSLTARKLLIGDHAVGRVIARPFAGSPGQFKRTEHRRDFAVKPRGKTVLNAAVEKGIKVIGIGKIEDIFSGEGITEGFHTGNNHDSMMKTIKLAEKESDGIIFTNLVDFDMLYGHRNDPIGYAKALQAFDQQLEILLNKLKSSDLLCITGDHGCDPTDVSTDHTREYVPILAYSPSGSQNIPLGTRETFADLGATCAEALRLPYQLPGRSFYSKIFVGAEVA
jgi:phosphopentomutase